MKYKMRIDNWIQVVVCLVFTVFLAFFTPTFIEYILNGYEETMYYIAGTLAYFILGGMWAFTIHQIKKTKIND